MPLVTAKKKFQIVIPQEVREVLAIVEGDILEAHVEDGRLVYTPKQVVGRDAALERIAAIAERAEASWRAEGMDETNRSPYLVGPLPGFAPTIGHLLRFCSAAGRLVACSEG